MTSASVIPMERREERAARATLAAMPEAQREALMEARDVELTLLMWAQGLEKTNPETGRLVRELADTLDDALCTLLGFTAFAVKDIPPEDET